MGTPLLLTTSLAHIWGLLSPKFNAPFSNLHSLVRQSPGSSHNSTSPGSYRPIPLCLEPRTRWESPNSGGGNISSAHPPSEHRQTQSRCLQSAVLWDQPLRVNPARPRDGKAAQTQWLRTLSLWAHSPRPEGAESQILPSPPRSSQAFPLFLTSPRVWPQGRGWPRSSTEPQDPMRGGISPSYPHHSLQCVGYFVVKTDDDGHQNEHGQQDSATNAEHNYRVNFGVFI